MEKHSLTLVELTQNQIKEAKKVNGQRKQITHSLVCGPHGKIFGTEKQCRKYFSVWQNVFPLIFCSSVEIEDVKINNYKSDFNLVNKLIKIHDSIEDTGSAGWEVKTEKEDSLFTKFLRYLAI